MALEPTSAKAYKEKSEGQTIVVPSGAAFKLRTLTMPEYVAVTQELTKKFGKRVKPEAILTVGWDTENPDIMIEYARLVLPKIVIAPKIVLTTEEETEESIAIDRLAPGDLVRLNMVSTTSSPGVRALIQSFLAEQSSSEELERVRNLATQSAE